MGKFESFEIDMSNGMSLSEIFKGKGEKGVREYLKSYVDYLKKSEREEDMDEFLFYEDEDIEFLKKVRVEELIG
jgi:hypothetical protein